MIRENSYFQTFAALLIFMRRTTPVEPSEPVEPAPPLSHVIKGQHAPWATPEPTNRPLHFSKHNARISRNEDPEKVNRKIDA